MAGINFFLLVCVSALTLVSWGFYSFLEARHPNSCNMTYMFEYPQYVKVSVSGEAERRFRAYGLYAYSEGKLTDKIRQMKFSGIPVLFIHGHRGSYKQVRSLASVSLRKALRSRSDFHFDFFSVDLNEEYSGISGGVLEQQTHFVRICIERILSLYSEQTEPPNSVVLVAHSMGGMIAKGLFMKDMPWSRVKLVITLATPHSPALVFDPLTAQYYDEVNDYWDTTDVGANVTLVSLGGGARDLIVPSGLVFSQHADISAVTPVVQDVWMEMDHQCILWCKELVLVLVRALFDSVDTHFDQISDNPQHLLNVFSYQLLQRSGSKEYSEAKKGGYKELTTLWKGSGDSSSWLRLRKNQLTWTRREELKVNTHILVPLYSVPQPADTLVIRTVNHKTEHWLFACTPDITVNNVKICSKGEDVSWRGRISPTIDYKRKTAVVDLVGLRMEGHSHLVVKTLPESDPPVEVSFDLFVHGERGASTESSAWPKGGAEVVAMSSPGELLRWVRLPGLTRPWQAYSLTVEPSPLDCALSRGFHSMAQVHIPWNNEGTNLLLSEERNSFVATMYSNRPGQVLTPWVDISFFLHPECSYTIKVEWKPWLSLGRLLWAWYPSLLSFLSVCLLMVLASQIGSLGRFGECPLLHFVLPKAAKPYYILPAVNIFAALTRGMAPYVPVSDVEGQSGVVETLVLPLLLHCSAAALLLMLASLVLLGVVFHGQAFNSVLLKFVSRLMLGLPWLSEWVLSGVSKLPVVVSCAMLTLSYAACSSLALYVGLVFYFFRLVSYYEEFWEELVYWPLRAVRGAVLRRLGRRTKEVKPLTLPPLRDVSFHLTLLLMWGVICFISTPSVLTWAHNYKYSRTLEKDPYLFTGVVLSFCGAFLWQAETPRTHLEWSGEVSRLVLSTCVGVLLYCQMSLYRLQAVLSIIMALVCCHQLAAPRSHSSDDAESEDSSLLSSTTAAFLHRLDSLLGNKPRTEIKPPQEASKGSLSTVNSDSTDRAQLSAGLTADSSADFSELSLEEDAPAASDKEVIQEEGPASPNEDISPDLSTNSSFENISATQLEGI